MLQKSTNLLDYIVSIRIINRVIYVNTSDVPDITDTNTLNAVSRHMVCYTERYFVAINDKTIMLNCSILVDYIDY